MTDLTRVTTRRMRLQSVGLLAVSVSALGACALPRSGPTKNEIYSGAVERGCALGL